MSCEKEKKGHMAVSSGSMFDFLNTLSLESTLIAYVLFCVLRFDYAGIITVASNNDTWGERRAEGDMEIISRE